MSCPSSATVTESTRTSLLRLLLQSDGLVVAIAGVALLARGRSLGSAVGLTISWPLVALGAGCLPYGAWLFRSGARASDRHLAQLARAIAVGNTVWVLASLAILLGGTPGLTVAGRWLLTAQAGVVALFATAEALVVRQTD
jgi:hypothetical protein